MRSINYSTGKTGYRKAKVLHLLFQKAMTALKWILGIGFAVVLFILLCNWIVVRQAVKYTYFSVKTIPSNEAGLVLGTSKGLEGGGSNLFFKYRMEATARLYKEGKVKYLILSGNNDSEYYNEPLDMQQALLALGVPEDAMVMDFAGKRTFDSVIRAQKVFNENNITIISQNFHTARALYIAHQEGVNAIAFAAQDVPDHYAYYSLIREYLARPKAILDVHLFRPQTDVTDNRELRRKE